MRFLDGIPGAAEAYSVFANEAESFMGRVAAAKSLGAALAGTPEAREQGPVRQAMIKCELAWRYGNADNDLTDRFCEVSSLIGHLQVPARPGLAFHVTLRDNLQAIQRQGLIPRIGERSAQLGEIVPRVYLFPDREACDNAMANWLGQCFEDVEEGGLVILEVDVSGLHLKSDAEFELACQSEIEVGRLLRVFDEQWNELQVGEVPDYTPAHAAPF